MMGRFVEGEAALVLYRGAKDGIIRCFFFTWIRKPDGEIAYSSTHEWIPQGDFNGSVHDR